MGVTEEGAVGLFRSTTQSLRIYTFFFTFYADFKGYMVS
jgi:hypothetical protein